jgi:GMP synthase (glutamine-hydrolysing)
VRVVGDIARARLDVLREADAIVQEEMMASEWYWKVWQSFAVDLPVKSVGVVGVMNGTTPRRDQASASSSRVMR